MEISKHTIIEGSPALDNLVPSGAVEVCIPDGCFFFLQIGAYGEGRDLFYVTA